jgi:hypothetical protein
MELLVTIYVNIFEKNVNKMKLISDESNNY